MTERKPYRSDLSDAEWAVIGPQLAVWRAPRPERKVSSNSQPVPQDSGRPANFLDLRVQSCSRTVALRPDGPGPRAAEDRV